MSGDCAHEFAEDGWALGDMAAPSQVAVPPLRVRDADLRRR
jgi:hypothetical protein